MKRLSVLLSATLLSASCGSAAVHGTVTAKQYIPARTQVLWQPYYGTRCVTQMTYVFVGSRRNAQQRRTCSTTLQGYHWVPVYHPGCWQLTLSGPQGGEECVSQDQYANTPLGAKL